MENKYTVLASLNEGHQIYLAKNIQNNQICVKKIMNIFNLDVYDFLYKTKPPGIPEIYDYKIENDQLIVYEEYINGLDLEEIIEKNITFTKEEILKLCSKICGILEKLNKTSIQIVHRDIKPSNIIYREDDIFLIDFNAAKIINESKEKDTILIGTEGYASPEQYGFGSSSIQSDIYSIGVLLKELAEKSNVYDSSIEIIVRRCTMIDPKKRYLTYNTLKFDLDNPNKYASRRYYPVGFRSANPFKMVLAIFGYLLILLIFSSVEADGSKFQTYLNKFFFVELGLIMVLYFGNYLNWWQKWGYKNNWNSFIKILWIIAVGFILFIVLIVLFLLVEGIIIEFIK